MSDENKNLPPFIYQRNKTLGIHDKKEQMTAWQWLDDSLSVTLASATIHTESDYVLRCDNAELRLPVADAERLRDYLNRAYPIDGITPIKGVYHPNDSEATNDS